MIALSIAVLAVSMCYALWHMNVSFLVAKGSVEPPIVNVSTIMLNLGNLSSGELYWINGTNTTLTIKNVGKLGLVAHVDPSDVYVSPNIAFMCLNATISKNGKDLETICIVHDGTQNATIVFYAPCIVEVETSGNTVVIRFVPASRQKIVPLPSGNYMITVKGLVVTGYTDKPTPTTISITLELIQPKISVGID